MGATESLRLITVMGDGCDDEISTICGELSKGGQAPISALAVAHRVFRASSSPCSTRRSGSESGP